MSDERAFYEYESVPHVDPAERLERENTSLRTSLAAALADLSHANDVVMTLVARETQLVEALEEVTQLADEMTWGKHPAVAKGRAALLRSRGEKG